MVCLLVGVFARVRCIQVVCFIIDLVWFGLVHLFCVALICLIDCSLAITFMPRCILFEMVYFGEQVVVWIGCVEVVYGFVGGGVI